MTEIVAMNPEAIDRPRLKEIVGKIREGAVVAYPTETFYGLGVDVTSPAAIKKLYEVKRRDWSNPVAVIVADTVMLEGIVAEVPEQGRVLMRAFWPGPVTILFRTNDSISRELTTNTGKIGIRISSHPLAQALCEALGAPLTTTSANLSGLPPSTCVRHLKNYFGDRLDIVIDGGQLEPSRGSTVVDVTEEKVVLIREGVVPAARIFEVLAA